jgi:hypothetical protein
MSAKAAASVEGEGRQRLGYATIWESGELDMQVLRRDDETLVLNEHRFVRGQRELFDALEVFAGTVSYIDPRDESG